MQTFGMPLVPSALALWAINFVDREFVTYYKGNGEVGVYSAAIKVASVITFVMLAFRTAWPAFAYSIEDDTEARRTYAFVLTYLMTAASWAALALGALAPWLVSLLTSNPRTSAPTAASRCWPSPLRRTRATASLRSAAAERGGRSSTGSSPVSAQR